MIKMADIIRVIMDGVRKQQILSVTMMFYQNNDITHVNIIPERVLRLTNCRYLGL